MWRFARALTKLSPSRPVRIQLPPGVEPAAGIACAQAGGGAPDEILAVLPPVDPPAVFAIGLNYAEHVREAGMKTPQFPVVLMKNPASVIPTGAAIRIPKCAADPPEVDYEAELAIVIGDRPCRNATRETALDYVGGFTAANDVSARRWQGNKRGGTQWSRSKSFDTFCPLGPALVSPQGLAEAGLSADALRITTHLNGELMQDSSTSDMVFGVAELIEFLSQDTTLLPGTVILTGTPPGVGFARKPPVYLKAGDVVRIEIEAIGVLENTVEACLASAAL